ncbi:hypothetical protein KQI52_04990 [bacterium]|nr:hypothetical protein [bacterium]
MSPGNTSGFTLWLRTSGKTLDYSAIVVQIAQELERRGVPVEPIDAAALARATYRGKISGQGLALAIAMSADALTRHGVACIIHGSRSSAYEFSWKKRKPERLLDVVFVRDGETVKGKGPFLVLRPGDGNGSSTAPDPPASAPVEPESAPSAIDSETSAASSSENIDSDRVTLDSADQVQSDWNLAPLFDALAKAGWIPPLAAPTNGDDELLRQRLRKLGYL